MSTFYLDPVNGNDANDGLGWYKAAFTSGGTYEIKAGDTVTDDTTAKTALVISVVVDSGTWAGGDAAGTLYVCAPTGAFTESGTISVGANSNVATLTADFAVNSWKTWTNGATAARIAPGDTIKIAKSPDPVSIGSCAWTRNSSSVTIPANTVLDIETCEAAWTPSANITAGTSTSYHSQGSKSATLTPATAFETGLAGYKDISGGDGGLDLSGYTKVSCWVAGSDDIAANTWRLDLCGNADGTGALVSFTFDRTISNRLYCGSCFTFDNVTALPSGVKSVALTALSDPGKTVIYIDNIIACNDLHLNCVISPNSDGPWFALSSISGTTVILGLVRSVPFAGYFTLASVTQTSYTREGYPNSGCTVQDSGTADNYIVFSGGWNKTTGEQDSHTWYYGVGGNTHVVGVSTYTYLQLENFGLSRSYNSGVGFGYSSLGGFIFKNLQSSSCSTGLYATASSCDIFLTGNIVCTGYANTESVLTSTIEYGLRGDADVDLYGLNSANKIQGFTGHSGRFTGKWRFFGNSANIATCALFASGDWFFKEIECYDTGPAGYSIHLNGGRVRIDKLTVSNAKIIYSLYNGASLDVGYFVYDSLSVNAYSPVRFEHFNADNRYKSYYKYGTISDHITGGQAENWAYGETGLSLLLNPTSNTFLLNHEFFVPVSAGTAYQIHFQKRKTSSGANCTLTLDICGCGITSIWGEFVSLTDEWSEHTSASFTPAYSGYVRCELHARDGSTTGDIGIDDIHLATV